jgi:hypothetical protein
LRALFGGDAGGASLAAGGGAPEGTAGGVTLSLGDGSGGSILTMGGVTGGGVGDGSIFPTGATSGQTSRGSAGVPALAIASALDATNA